VLRKEINELMETLLVIQTVYDKDNWNVLGSRAITKEVIINARTFLNLILNKIPIEKLMKPTLEPLINGNLLFYWSSLNIECGTVNSFSIEITDTELIECKIESKNEITDEYWSNINDLSPVIEKEIIKFNQG
jgi:hypothetical protein